MIGKTNAVMGKTDSAELPVFIELQKLTGSAEDAYQTFNVVFDVPQNYALVSYSYTAEEAQLLGSNWIPATRKFYVTFAQTVYDQLGKATVYLTIAKTTDKIKQNGYGSGG